MASGKGALVPRLNGSVVILSGIIHIVRHHKLKLKLRTEISVPKRKHGRRVEGRDEKPPHTSLFFRNLGKRNINKIDKGN